MSNIRIRVDGQEYQNQMKKMITLHDWVVWESNSGQVFGELLCRRKRECHTGRDRPIFYTLRPSPGDRLCEGESEREREKVNSFTYTATTQQFRSYAEADTTRSTGTKHARGANISSCRQWQERINYRATRPVLVVPAVPSSAPHHTARNLTPVRNGNQSLEW